MPNESPGPQPHLVPIALHWEVSSSLPTGLLSCSSSAFSTPARLLLELGSDHRTSCSGLPWLLGMESTLLRMAGTSRDPGPPEPAVCISCHRTPPESRSPSTLSYITCLHVPSVPDSHSFPCYLAASDFRNISGQVITSANKQGGDSSLLLNLSRVLLSPPPHTMLCHTGHISALERFFFV